MQDVNSRGDSGEGEGSERGVGELSILSHSIFL